MQKRISAEINRNLRKKEKNVHPSTQPTITRSKLAVEKLEQGVEEYVQI